MPDRAPFEDERQAHAAAVAAIPPEPGWSILSQAQRDRLLHDALTAAGVETSAYEDGTAWWLGNWGDHVVAIIARWIHDAHEAGKAAGPAGAVTKWGVRLASVGGRNQVIPEATEEIARNYAATTPLASDPQWFVRVVTRQVGPWTEAPETTEGKGQGD